MKSKKGAIELSMTTIIVIVIGITLLTLGLTWVRSSLNDVMDLTDQAFKMSDQEIENMFSQSDELLKILPDSAEIKKGDAAEVAVIFYNPTSAGAVFQARAVPVEEGVDVLCNFVETQTATSSTHNLQSGSNAKLKLRAETTKEGTLGYGACRIEMISPTSEQTGYQDKKALSIKVIG